MAEKLKKKSAAKVPHKPDLAELPRWATFTAAVFYQLEMGEETNGVQQSIDLTREEYIAVKEYLAKMRGYAVPAEATNA